MNEKERGREREREGGREERMEREKERERWRKEGIEGESKRGSGERTRRKHVSVTHNTLYIYINNNPFLCWV